jgi:hypothetical protein
MLIRRCVEVSCFERAKVHSVRRFSEASNLAPFPYPHACFCFVQVPFPKDWPLYCATFALQKLWLKLGWCANIGFLHGALYRICFITCLSFLFGQESHLTICSRVGRYKLRPSFSLSRSFTVLLPYVLPVDSSTRQRYQGPGSRPFVRVTFAKSLTYSQVFRTQLGPSRPKFSEES